ncbi:Amine oxidase [Penicillium canariense]|uniref:Amine oxidase n=1 Tax=Penicillium canariense TaxID=189055 RepID=A0A9W9LE90_9EURO|nr:Amine oxidase [Penicillium canariense]KAJ5151103.1 Amine oxidase [Penicillium canariense]
MPKVVETVDLSTTSSAYYAPATIAPAGKVIHIAGQPGSTKDGVVPTDYESQIHLALLNLRKLIIAAESSIEHIVKLNLYIVDYDAASRKHARHVQRFLGRHRPAITLIPVPKLAVPSWLFEIDAVIALPEPSLPPVLSAATENTDIIIVGAGLAGLSAAHDVLSAGLSCVILEARDRVGGKTWNMPLKDGKGIVDLGAAWTNDSNQSRVYALVRRLGVEMIEQNTRGSAVLQDFDGECTPFAYGELPNFDEATQAHVAEIRDMCEADCQALDTWRPKETSLDSVTFDAYLRSRGASEIALATATVWTRAMLGQDPKDISALYFLNYCKSGGGLLQMRSDRKHGGQYLRIRQGTQALSLGLASSLPADIVRLSSPVHSVIQNMDRSVQVHAGGAVFAARKVIITVPSPCLRNISFHPKLPPAKQTFIESTTYGYYTKAMVEFRSPFWVQRGFCGLAQSFTGPASVVRDTSSPEDRKYVLTCFMSGDPGRAWAALPAKEREQSLLQQLGKLFGVTDLDNEFVQLAMYEWTNDEYAGWGCPCAALTPGVLDTVGPDALRENAGNLHFAGTETAGEWKGYMEGAVRSGERAAAEVIKALNSDPSSRL